MAEKTAEYERTIGFAEIALSQIKALRQPVTPRNYEICYAYATGDNPSLNQTINETLQKTGSLADADLKTIYSRYLSSTGLTDGLDQIGSRVLDEINQVMATVDGAIGTTSNYHESLAGVTSKLGSAKDRDGIRAIIESLVQTAHEMQKHNNDLQANLGISKKTIGELQDNLEVVRHESLTDTLTGLANRKHFDNAITKALHEAIERSEPLSLLMTDIDHFKSFNDTWGHLTGDQVLRLVAASLKQNVKGHDTAARYGGEEFAVVLPNTVLRSALVVGDHLRRAVMSKQLVKRSTGQNLGKVTISVGAATVRSGDSVQSLIARADACLYTAKRNGRNRVICETDPELAASGEAKVA
jgi:diguanylate cyclase